MGLQPASILFFSVPMARSSSVESRQCGGDNFEGKLCAAFDANCSGRGGIFARMVVHIARTSAQSFPILNCAGRRRRIFTTPLSTSGCRREEEEGEGESAKGWREP